MKLYAMPKSGNCYKAAWMLNVLKIPYELVHTSSSVDGGTKSVDFLGKNPNGQVPLLELDDGRLLAESNAILLYLAEQQQQQQRRAAESCSDETPVPSLLPQDPCRRALVYQWLFFEQNSHEPAIAVRRGNIVFERPCPEAQMQAMLDKGHRALVVMETQLGKTPYVAGDEMTVADIALFAYTHLAHEGGYDMDRYPNIQRWLRNVQQSPGFCGIDILEQ